MKSLALQLLPESAAALAPWRLHTAASIHASAAGTWLIIRPRDEAEARHLRGLPSQQVRDFDDGQLFALEGRVPLGTLPEVDLLPLAQWLQLVLPVVLPPAAAPSPYLLKPVADDAAEGHPAALLCALRELLAWAETVSILRLQNLRFAVQGPQAIVLGSPLPSCPGRLFIRQENLLVPAGHRVPLPQLLADKLALAEDHLALFSLDGSWELLPAEAFAPLSLASLRMTQKESR